MCCAISSCSSLEIAWIFSIVNLIKLFVVASLPTCSYAASKWKWSKQCMDTHIPLSIVVTSSLVTLKNLAPCVVSFVFAMTWKFICLAISLFVQCHWGIFGSFRNSKNSLVSLYLVVDKPSWSTWDITAIRWHLRCFLSFTSSSWPPLACSATGQCTCISIVTTPETRFNFLS
jgi:hypothetical protein